MPAQTHGADVLKALRPLAIDVGIPVGSYYLLRDAFGVNLWLALALSSVGPAVRTCYAMAAERSLNALAALILAVNVAGIVVSLLTGNPRDMIAKDSLVSSVFAIAILGSVLAHRPLMSAGLRPWVTRGTAGRDAAWERLVVTSARFRRFESLYSSIWGVALLGECVARVIGAYTLPVSTMVWLGGVMTLSAIGLAITLGGVAVAPIERMVRAETSAADRAR